MNEYVDVVQGNAVPIVLLVAIVGYFVYTKYFKKVVPVPVVVPPMVPKPMPKPVDPTVCDNPKDVDDEIHSAAVEAVHKHMRDAMEEVTGQSVKRRQRSEPSRDKEDK